MVKVFYGLSMRKFWCILLMAQMLSVGAETLRVMQLNVWNSGYGVPGARVMIGDEIKKHRPDIVFLCECVKDRIVDDLLAPTEKCRPSILRQPPRWGQSGDLTLSNCSGGIASIRVQSRAES